MYSLVSAPVLGFDLTRLDGGAATAAVLSRALRLDSRDLATLARRLPDDGVRAQLWQDIHAATVLRPTVRSLSQQDAEGALALLERAPIGTPDALLHCVRHDVLGWTWQEQEGVRRQDDTASAATAVVCDAVMATYLRELLPADTRRRLAVGWLAATRELPDRPVDTGPQHQAVTGLCRRIETLGASDLERLTALSDRTRLDSSGWSQAVHEASWAVHMSDRVRAAAAAQFELVQAVDAAGIPVADRAGGVWNLLSGAVHALTVADLLDAALLGRLLDPCLGVLGLPVLR
ncbi:hypothetical protein HS048_36095 [Planomonospora sp. ID91781]|uniref:Uncharacterized protein n=1 Tax=Planomonospora sphaerica TaxID=161355 RepID=A0A171DQ04_9ACTN|nr:MULTISPECIES: hypothetical protein [Planomonospora]MBG0826092.1 hypothetical protein [Planomonospora sp. ID91781]GAT71134.1 hypothetical protein PS9374_06825 [Planomonospora sphaerica]